MKLRTKIVEVEAKRRPEGDWEVALPGQDAPLVVGRDDLEQLFEIVPKKAEKPGPGLFRKYIVTRTEGKQGVGEKHHNCRYWVLDLDHDPHAKIALMVFAAACGEEHPNLERDLRKIYRGGGKHNLNTGQ